MIVEDAAHATGAVYNKKRIGNHGFAVCFSFHPVKHITSGEGGAILANDESLFKNMKRMSSHGIVRTPEMLMPASSTAVPRPERTSRINSE